MWRGGNASTTMQDKGGGGGGMVLECETEGLSDAQLTRIQKLKDEVSRLQKLMQTSAVQKQNEITVPVLVNGTVGNGTPGVTAPITNGPSMLGLQVPQFLLLQNGQMIAASSAIQPASLASTNPGSTFPISTTAGSIQPPFAFKATTPRTTPSHLSQALSRPQRISVTTSKGTTSSSPVVNSSSDDIQVLGEMIASSPGSSSSRGLRDVRIQAPSGSTSTTTTPTTTFRVGFLL
ncbi:hypothetical protein GWK47_000058 [Chionoecetes opilio]|uniref:Uncharacterized protein n=1 Tax=Chionoecetes opilio TaxID=41210 RepID=A0A8J4Y7J6_CHIOP|nr:hypothetical protein GWK47_000058 [Chionoecetes opilio]